MGWQKGRHMTPMLLRPAIPLRMTMQVQKCFPKGSHCESALFFKKNLVTDTYMFTLHLPNKIIAKLIWSRHMYVHLCALLVLPTLASISPSTYTLLVLLLLLIELLLQLSGWPFSESWDLVVSLSFSSSEVAVALKFGTWKSDRRRTGLPGLTAP